MEIIYRMFRRHPIIFTVTIVLYTVLTMYLFFLKGPYRKLFFDEKQIMELKSRINELDSLKKEQEKIISTLTKRAKTSSFLKNQNFEEKWDSEENRENILRLVEYANFALSKSDFSYAERLFNEANQIQDTLIVTFNLGKTNYLQGDIEKAIFYWKKITENDQKGNYPDLRLYLGVANYELGNDNDSKKYLDAYLKLK